MQAEIPIQVAGAVVAIGFYFLPALVADRRHRHDALTIALFNALFAWTGIGWLLTLYWACQPNPSPDVVNEIHANRRGHSMRIFSAGLVERVQRRIVAQERWTHKHHSHHSPH
ncbi:superinfection immunity protein [Burkholderia guangdongensis]|uniref:superinfection immunity protein n=1 Tax=Burkholderia guangdongensis TaxID=1792500 RepID=UPI0015CC352A|nr:superinfection immunity protein [Burkholderia guangdongensis]